MRPEHRPRPPRPAIWLRRSIPRAALAACLALASAAAAAPEAGEPTPGIAPDAAIARQLASEIDAIDRASEIVAGKRAVVEVTRHRRLRAAYRVLRAAPGDDPLAAARRRAVARMLVERDRLERTLLVEEAAQLTAARQRVTAETTALPQLVLPQGLAAPVPGKVTRRFGSLVHERSKATLSRRGIDLEVDERSPVTAPAAGTVRYAGPIRGLDQGVIIDHGGYVTVIAKLGELALPVGAPIAAGDRIGRAARHRVYFEVRLKLGPGGVPLDPEAVLVKPR